MRYTTVMKPYEIYDINAIANVVGKHPTHIRSLLSAGICEIDGFKMLRLGNQWVGTKDPRPLQYIAEDYHKKRGTSASK